jgi:tripartite-type tricarboxylate transporter receptor subunit TctC
MLHARRAAVFTSLALAATSIISAPAAAQSVAEFYKGKTVSVIMGTGPGGSYEPYGRTIAEHMRNHIPGNPTVIVEFMPGAGGVTAGNHIFGPGPQDGTKILLSHAIPMSQMLEPRGGVRFESDKFHWLGTYDAIAHTMALWHEAPVKTIADLKNPQLVIGSFAKAHLTYQWPAMMKDVLGLGYKVITGYPTGNHNNLAMERGEIHGWAASWENLASTRPHWVPEKKVTLLAQFVLERKPQIPDVPTLLELAPADKKDVVEFLTAGTPFGRAMAVGPGVPADRVAALRKAFDDTMKDPAFLADAKKRSLDIDPRNWQNTHTLVKKIVGASPDLVTRVKASIGVEE